MPISIAVEDQGPQVNRDQISSRFCTRFGSLLSQQAVSLRNAKPNFRSRQEHCPIDNNDVNGKGFVLATRNTSFV